MANDYIFEYLGRHFEPIREFTDIEREMPLKDISRYLAFERFEGYTRADFLAASPDNDADVYRCREDNLLYIPGDAYLEQYSFTLRDYITVMLEQDKDSCIDVRVDYEDALDPYSPVKERAYEGNLLFAPEAVLDRELMNVGYLAAADKPCFEIKSKVLELPKQCYSVVGENDELVLIKRGRGFSRCNDYKIGMLTNRQYADATNEVFDVSPAQEAAMVGGIKYGWNSPEADTSRYDT